MRGYDLLKSVCRLILPFIILYGLYVIMNGDMSPGGGFQGGVVLATCYLILFFIKDEETISFKSVVKIEKRLFIGLIVLTILHMSSFSPISKLLPELTRQAFAVGTLLLLNLVIGLKVTIGFWGIMLIFTEEGRL